MSVSNLILRVLKSEIADQYTTNLQIFLSLATVVHYGSVIPVQSAPFYAASPWSTSALYSSLCVQIFSALINWLKYWSFVLVVYVSTTVIKGINTYVRPSVCPHFVYITVSQLIVSPASLVTHAVASPSECN